MRPWLIVLAALGVAALVDGGGAGRLRGEDPAPSKPPWQRLLQGADAKKAEKLDKQLEELQEAGKFEEALPAAEELAALRSRVQGPDHWEVVDARYVVEALRRALRAEKAVRATYAQSFTWRSQVETLVGKGRYPEARALMDSALTIRRKVLGEDHPATAQGWNDLGVCLDSEGQYSKGEEALRKGLATFRKVLGEDHPETARCRKNLAFNLGSQGQYREAEEGLRTALASLRRVLGEDHPDTAMGYAFLASNLSDQGRYQEAEEGYAKALAIHRKILGDDNTVTAKIYNDLATNLDAEGKYREAEEGHRKALAIRRKVLGEGHPATATSYNNLAANFNAQGKYRDAEEGFKEALGIFRKAYGEDHPSTAGCCNNLGMNLDMQGHSKEAEEVLERGLAICRRVLGEDHPNTAVTYDNLAACWVHQGLQTKAQEARERALAIRRKTLGENHPRTALSYNHIATLLRDQGRYREAEAFFQKALAIRLEVLGKDHPDIAISYDTEASNLNAQGRFKEAEALGRKALALYRKVLGENHLDAATCSSSVAANLNAQGRYQEAEELYLRSAAAFLASRLQIAASGLERTAKASEQSPLLRLAALLARNGRPAAAWEWLEQGLGRGAGDDLAARLRRPMEDLKRQTELAKRLERLDHLLTKQLALREPTAAQKQERNDLLDRHLKAQEELTRFGHSLEEKYGAADGKVFDRKQIQAALPADTALVVWIDFAAAGSSAADPNGEHWAVLLRSQGEPIVERLHGRGPGGDWSAEDTDLPGRLRKALTDRKDWELLARQLTEQRIGPLRKHLAASEKLPRVRHLVVLPSTALAGIPVELLVQDCSVSYALSGTLHAHLLMQPAVASTGLLTVGDPVFTPPAARGNPQPLPPGGLLLTLVEPGSNAAESRLRPNDVLLKYGDVVLKTPADLPAAVKAAGAGADIPLQVWRDGATLERKVRPGKLGVVVAGEPAPQALAERYQFDRRLSSRGGDDDWTALPGTRVEVESLHRLFGDRPRPKLLLDSEASEENLDELAARDDLGKYRYLHLATHAQVDDAVPLRSAIILSRDNLPDPHKQLLAGKPVYDGRLTAEEMLRSWHLCAELVTLSACETGLGKYEKGEGFVGFAQALILCGSRSVCLSLWKVDDAATALLMQRFYANLLGKREGLKSPLPKAEALVEAKRWLRTLSSEQALKQAALVYQGVDRGKRPKLPLLPALPEPVRKAEEDYPYAHPYYWAAFVLIGDPG
jgi:tetratricopeptide (TPR) repeat protein